MKKLEQLYGRATMLDVTILRGTLINAQLQVLTNKINYLNTYTQFNAILGISTDLWGIKVV